NGVTQPPQRPACSIGPDFAWGTVAATPKPAAVLTGAPTGRTLYQYMSYSDNPQRPRHRGWFGPMTMIQFISDTGLLPGTAHDISMYVAKYGIYAALTDIANNHPNDMLALIMFSRPHFSNDPASAASVGAFQNAQVNLSHDYTAMMNALWYPPNSGSADVT